MKYELINKITKYDVKEQIFYNRNIMNIKDFVNPTKNNENDYHLLKNIDKGIKILAKHISNFSKTCIIVDSDADGFTSSALLLNYLYTLFPCYATSITRLFHEGKSHGISSELFDSVKQYEFVICIDSSSNDYQQHEELKNLGIDVLVIDHHLADKESENACIINNQLCEYPNKTLSGAGVVLKFCQGIDEVLGVNNADSFYDLAALGIISDVMLTTDLETRYIIKRGMDNINNPFFSMIADKQTFCLKEGLNPIGIAFYITPFINAITRSGTLEDNILLFDSMLSFEANKLIPSTKRGEKGKTEKLVTQSVRNCGNIKRHQDDEKKKLSEYIDDFIRDNELDNNKIIIVKLQEYLDKNLIGLLANQIMGKYRKPTIILNQYEHGWSGSARNVGGTEFKDFRDFVRGSGFSNLAEGHQSAFGCGFETEEDIDSFIKYANIRLKNISFENIYQVDFIYGNDEINEKEILDICSLHDYYGQGFEEPMIALENLYVKDIVLLSPDKNPTLKITLPNNISIIKFKSSQEEYERLKSDIANKAVKINLVGKCSQNFWNGNVSAQIIMEDYEIVKEEFIF